MRKLGHLVSAEVGTKILIVAAAAVLASAAVVLLSRSGSGVGQLSIGPGTGGLTLTEVPDDLAGEIASSDSCAQLHDLVLATGAVAAPALDEQATAERADQPVTATPGDDGQDEVTRERLLHAGGLGASMVTPAAAAPYGLWADGSVLAAQLTGWSLGPEATLEQEARAQAEMEALHGAPAARADELGCDITDEYDAIARHLDLPPAGVERDLAALERRAELNAEILGDGDDLLVAYASATTEQRRVASALTRLLEGPPLPDDEEALPDVLDHVVAAIDPDAPDDEVLPPRFIPVAEVGDATGGTCVVLRLRQATVVADVDDPAGAVVLYPPPGIAGEFEFFKNLDPDTLPAGCRR